MPETLAGANVVVALPPVITRFKALLPPVPVMLSAAVNVEVAATVVPPAS